MPLRLLDKLYHPLELNDIEKDILECLDPRYNAAAIAVEQDDHLEFKGQFRIVVEWIDTDT